jgi:nucleoside-diphosphate-sugar epimerase
MKKTVLITGAEGLIGSHLSKALADIYDLRLITLQPISGVDSFVLDIADMEKLLPIMHGVDSVVHLAGSSAVTSSWESVLHNNIEGTYTVFEAAYQAGVQQVIFASSNHAVGTYEQEQAPDIYRRPHASLDHLVPPRPDSFYGVSKCFGEALGRFYADHRNMRVICLRIGSITVDDRPDGPGVAQTNLWLPTIELRYERFRTTWMSQRDFARLVEKCIEATQVRFDIFYGISNNPSHFFDLEHAQQVLGYIPEDSSTEQIQKP